MSLNRTHYRKADGLRAELLADRDGVALYKVDVVRRFRGNVRLSARFTSCSSERFARVFAEAA